ncbi:MAG: hypothetical protein JXA03_02960, partial [Bacteroidales bacterium]|nr:hypothetical protein [Bacteroidales bacterium]
MITIKKSVSSQIIFLFLLLAVHPVMSQTPGKNPLIPVLKGEWIKLCDRPQLEKWHSPKAEPVDFTVFQADDKTWHLISCVRNTTQPGSGRLLYRWSSSGLERENWTPEGIFLSS